MLRQRHASISPELCAGLGERGSARSPQAPSFDGSISFPTKSSRNMKNSTGAKESRPSPLLRLTLGACNTRGDASAPAPPRPP